MASGRRISRSINVFDKYIQNTSSYLESGTPVTNGERLGLSESEVTEWLAFKDEWIPICLKYNDKTNSRTQSVINNLYAIIDRTISFDQDNHILDRIAASSKATIDDFGIFNINGGVLPKTTRSLPTSRISEPVTVTFQLLGGGDILIKCYSLSGKRASIYEGADCVQFLYQTGSTPPASADEDTLKLGLSTKGLFTLPLGPGSSGKNLYIYFRWFNTKHPELAGSWSALQITMIV